MKITLLKFAIFLSAIALGFSCTKDDPSELDGNQSAFGEVGNEIEWTVGQFGITDAVMYVSKLEDGISTFACSGSTTEGYYIDLLKMMPIDRFPGSFTISGNTIMADVKAKITDNGMQAVFEDGTTFTLVKYDAQVGDKYTAVTGGITLENEVIEKSSEDDYYWQGILIKVITVRYKSHTPGILYVDFVYNHKFGMVGMGVHFEDGSATYAGIKC
jgi:hypothetical protein